MTPPLGPHQTMTTDRRPRSNQTVSVTFDEDGSALGMDSSRLSFEVSECVETKTVTTTTTTKRTFPPLHVRESRPLSHLDGKEYPLANKPLPPELVSFSYSIPSFVSDEICDGLVTSSKRIEKAPATRISAGLLKDEESSQESIRHGPGSPSDAYPRKPRSVAAPPAQSAAGFWRPSRPAKIASRTQAHPDSITHRLRRHLAMTTQREMERSGGTPANFLATPETSEVITGTGGGGGSGSGSGSATSTDRLTRPRPLHLDRLSRTPESEPPAAPMQLEPSSPVDSETQTVFSSNVATPPITDADAEPFQDADESLQQSIRALGRRPSLDGVASQDASLPSPRLSPTLAAAQLHPNDPEDVEEDDVPFGSSHGSGDGPVGFRESQTGDELESNSTLSMNTSMVMGGDSSHTSAEKLDPHATMLDVRSMIETFDAMPNEMKSFLMYNFLRRCPRKTLRLVADTVTPALKCDFLRQLPLELSFNVLSHLDHRDLCRAAQVSKHWRNIIDTNETGWKELLDRDGYILPPGELAKAVAQGWGWQDPVGAMGAEVDLSKIKRLHSGEGDETTSSTSTSTSTSTSIGSSTSSMITMGKPDPTARLRSAKRKRGLNHLSGADRSKRRAGAQEASRSDSGRSEARQHKSEGPLSAANAAAAAVPNPEMGLPSLQKLHLFKSLYRRHHMIRKSWTSGKVKPGHVAFAAHPRHVITSLQFDEDKIITGSDDTLIHVYDTKTGKLRKKLEGHEGGVWALQYVGNVLVSGSTDRSVRVWDIEKGLCTQVFYGHTSTVRCLQILMPTEVGKTYEGKPIMMPPKPLIITGSRDSQLRVWRLPEPGSRRYIQTGPPANEADCPYFIRTLTGHTQSVRAIAAHGDTLVSGSYDSTVRVWRISTGESLHVLRGHSQKVYSVVLDHERNRCISGSMDSLVKIWDLETGACLHTLEGHSLLVGLLDLRDQKLVSAAADSTLRIWDPENGKCRNTLTAHTGAITCFQHDGQKVISGSEKTVKMWDIKTGECMQDLLTDLNGVWQVKFDERRCVAAVQRGSLTYVEVSLKLSRYLSEVCWRWVMAANFLFSFLFTDSRLWCSTRRQAARGVGRAETFKRERGQRTFG
ncbi:cell division control protein [Sodiomyces alkalinus F11]|uniref:Cell division control protein n=1 Tax=Sodiomyces alkalinus (strain CBS 110278 / VKM F-3762 / F11) TaxID=1314773 RepID=A0A3N2QAL8_SODAK|nr:cell division control protein [Sodiomyces alkalinus F11]ROT43794.1 cell division control protein [Sodiomyces alkalinus F11]